MAELIIDTRERAITQYSDVLKEIPYKIEQITVGDYIVKAGQKILAVIERKSLSDFASSFKDGRINNREKMFEMRAATNCRVLFIIEGPAYPEPSQLFGRIAYKNIESSIHHMMIRDCVSVIHTENSFGTAQMLVRFINNMNSMLTKIGGKTEQLLSPQPLADPVDCDVDAEMNKKFVKSDDAIITEMWACLPRITVNTAPAYVRKWSLADIVTGAITLDQLKSEKMASGKKIGPKILQTLAAAPVSPEIHIRMLEKIPGLSHARAKDLLTGREIGELLALDLGQLANLEVGKAARKLGKAKAEKILFYFNYRPNTE